MRFRSCVWGKGKRLIIVTVWVIFFISLGFCATPVRANTDTRIRIAIIDTGINKTFPGIAPFLCQDGHQDFTGSASGWGDKHGHGTNVAWLITQNLDPKKYCIIALKFYDSDSSHAISPSTLDSTINAWHAILRLGVQYVNFSAGGHTVSKVEVDLIKRALERDIVVTVSAGNDGQNLSANCNYHPVCSVPKHVNFHVIGNCKNKKYSVTSNYGGPVTACVDGTGKGPSTPYLKMSGTSQSAAIFLNLLLQGKNP